MIESIEGPVARSVAVIIIVTVTVTVTELTLALALALGCTSGSFRRLVQSVFGLSIAFAASLFFLSFFSFASGAVVA